MERVPFEAVVDLDYAAERMLNVLGADGVVLVPTETYYGLAGSPFSPGAVERIMILKDRPPTMPLPVVAGDWEQIEGLVEVPEAFRAGLHASWPGPLTAVLPARRSIAASGGGTIAVRIPGHSLLRQLLLRVGPVTGTSANRHGMPAPSTVKDALSSLGGSPDLALEGGRTEGGGPSTVVLLTGDSPLLLRSGKNDEIIDIFGK